MKYIIICMLSVCTTFGQGDFDQEYSSEGIQHVLIDNLKGNIHVEVGTSQSIEIKAKASNFSATSSLKLKEIKQKGLIAIYIEKPCRKDMGQFDPEDPFSFVRNENNCGWNGKEDDLPTYDFIVKIPKSMNIYASTIMDGKVSIQNITGNVYASNINGDVVLDGVSKVSNATTINGDVDVTYDTKPKTSGKFSTINGEINLLVPPSASLTTKFSSFMGELYTDFDAVELISNKEDKDKVKAGKMINIEEYSEAKIGTGEVSFLIKTFNGNAYLKESK